MGSQIQEADTESWITYVLCVVLTFAVILLASVCCLIARCKKKNKKIKVLCTTGDNDYKSAFKFFIERNLHRKLKWINNTTGLKRKSKYVLLCDLENRIPGEVQRVLHDLGITIEEEEADILVVVMRKESGGHDTVFNFIGTEDHPLHHLLLTNIFYYQTYPISGAVNDKAEEDIKSFFR